MVATWARVILALGRTERQNSLDVGVVVVAVQHAGTEVSVQPANSVTEEVTRRVSSSSTRMVRRLSLYQPVKR